MIRSLAVVFLVACFAYLSTACGRVQFDAPAVGSCEYEGTCPAAPAALEEPAGVSCEVGDAIGVVSNAPGPNCPQMRERGQWCCL